VRYVIHGAGALGRIAGARLFERGHDVMLIRTARTSMRCGATASRCARPPTRCA